MISYTIDIIFKVERLGATKRLSHPPPFPIMLIVECLTIIKHVGSMVSRLSPMEEELYGAAPRHTQVRQQDSKQPQLKKGIWNPNDTNFTLQGSRTYIL